MAEIPITTGVPPEWQISEIPDPTRSKAHGPKKHLNDPTRTFVCEICSARFKRSEHLRRHRASRHAEPKEACLLCEYKAAREDNLKSHIRVVHGAAELNEYLAAKEDTETRATYFVELGLTTWREMNAAEGYPKDAFMTGSTREDNDDAVQSAGQELDQPARKNTRAQVPARESAALSGPIAHPRVVALGGGGTKRKRGDNSTSSTMTPVSSTRRSHVTLPSTYPVSFTSPSVTPRRSTSIGTSTSTSIISSSIPSARGSANDDDYNDGYEVNDHKDDGRKDDDDDDDGDYYSAPHKKPKITLRLPRA